jgi:hypothetical protein
VVILKRTTLTLNQSKTRVLLWPEDWIEGSIAGCKPTKCAPRTAEVWLGSITGTTSSPTVHLVENDSASTPLFFVTAAGLGAVNIALKGRPLNLNQPVQLHYAQGGEVTVEVVFFGVED